MLCAAMESWIASLFAFAWAIPFYSSGNPSVGNIVSSEAAFRGLPRRLSTTPIAVRSYFLAISNWEETIVAVSIAWT